MCHSRLLQESLLCFCLFLVSVSQSSSDFVHDAGQGGGGCFDLVVLGGEWTGSFFASFLNQMNELPLVSVLSL